MSTVPSLQGAAALLLRPTHSGVQAPGPALAGNAVLASANGMKLIVDPATKQAQVKVSEVLFESDRVNTLTLKVHLMERAAGALGVKKDEFTSDADYRAAIRQAFVELSLKPDARRRIAAIEKDLGLDKLGVSLKTLVDATAAEDPKANEKLDAALAKHAQTLDGDREPARVLMSEIGVYKL